MHKVPSILVVNGPNLNLLGRREPEWYGSHSLDQIVTRLQNIAEAAGIGLSHFQSNAEHLLIERIHQARDVVNFILINPGALGHTSLALADALSAVAIPYIEIHLSQIYAREPMRRNLLLAPRAEGLIAGFGSLGYELALTAALARLTKAEN